MALLRRNKWGQGFPGGSVVKNLPTDAGDVGSVPGLGRSPGEGNSNPLQYSCLGNRIDKRAWWAIVHGIIKEFDTTSRVNKKGGKQKFLKNY